MNAPAELKKKMRKQLLEARDRMSPAEHAVKSEMICRHLLDMLKAQARTRKTRMTVMAFSPFRSEPAIQPVLEWCWAGGCRLMLPRVNTAVQEMDVCLTAGYSDLSEGAYGIREPGAFLPSYPKLEEIDLVLVPGSAFDLQGGRLGYGGGYYDRFLARIVVGGHPLPQLVAPAFEQQIVAVLPLEPHDFRVGRIVTETRDYEVKAD